MEQSATQPTKSRPLWAAVGWRDLAIAALVLLAAALGIILWQTRLPQEGSNDVQFARDMSAHHEQAVTMAFMLHERDPQDDLRALTEDMMFTQHGQIGQMHGWLAVWGQTISGSSAPMDGMGEMMGMATRDEVKLLGTLPLPEAEIRFLQLMIRHHQGGVMMAEDIVGTTRRPEVRRLAQSIIDSQQSEIKVMTDMLAQRGAKPLAPLLPMDMSHHDS